MRRTNWDRAVLSCPAGWDRFDALIANVEEWPAPCVRCGGPIDESDDFDVLPAGEVEHQGPCPTPEDDDPSDPPSTPPDAGSVSGEVQCQKS